MNDLDLAHASKTTKIAKQKVPLRCLRQAADVSEEEFSVLREHLLWRFLCGLRDQGILPAVYVQIPTSEVEEVSRQY